MLGRIVVTEIHSFFEAVDSDDKTLCDGFTNNVDTGQEVGLTINLVFYGVKLRLGNVDAYEDNL